MMSPDSSGFCRRQYLRLCPELLIYFGIFIMPFVQSYYFVHIFKEIVVKFPSQPLKLVQITCFPKKNSNVTYYGTKKI